MNTQTFVIDKKDFEPKHIFECGQCFRWNLNEDGSYTGVFKNNLLNVKKEKNKIIFSGICDGKIEEVVKNYFDLETDYLKIKSILTKVDENMAKSIEYGEGIRILNQDLWEVIISFIISANNNIPRIKKIIERLSKTYGTKITEEYYTFPTVQQLSKASIDDLREIGLGFRDKYVYETTKKFVSGEINLDELKNMETVEARKILQSLQGIGPKVADCILLFGMHRFEVFPIDVWVRRVMNELYIKSEEESKVKKEEIEQLAVKKYENLAGIAQQYLFYWKRETA